MSKILQIATKWFPLGIWPFIQSLTVCLDTPIFSASLTMEKLFSFNNDFIFSPAHSILHFPSFYDYEAHKLVKNNIYQDNMIVKKILLFFTKKSIYAMKRKEFPRGIFFKAMSAKPLKRIDKDLFKDKAFMMSPTY